MPGVDRDRRLVLLVLRKTCLSRVQDGEGIGVVGAPARVDDLVLRPPDAEDVRSGAPAPRVGGAAELLEVVALRCELRAGAGGRVDVRRRRAVAPVQRPADADAVGAGRGVVRVRSTGYV